LFGLIPQFGPWELILVLVIVLVIFGPGKLPGIGKAIGSSLKEFKKATGGSDTEEKDQKEEPKPPKAE